MSSKKIRITLIAIDGFVAVTAVYGAVFVVHRSHVSDTAVRLYKA